MRRLFTFADRYYRQRDWKMLVPLKFCLLAAGCLLGLTVKKERKRPVALAALVVFFGTYVPLMIDMLQALPTLWPREKAPEEAEEAETPDAEEEAPAEAAQETPEDEPAQVSEETVAEETEAPEAPAEEPAQPSEEAPQEASEEAEAPAEPAEESDEEEVSAPI